MQAKAFMEDVRNAEAEIRRLSDQKTHLYELATSISPNWSGDRVQTTVSSKVENSAAKIVDLTRELDLQIGLYVDKVRRANDLISKIPQEKFRRVLTMYYILGWNTATIRTALGYTDDKSAYRCREYALRELQRLL